MTRVTGILPPVTTPFVGDDFSPEKLVHNLEYLLSTDISGIVVLGSNGETPFLTAAEKLNVVSVAARMKGTKLLIAGTGLESIKETIALTYKVADAGADVALVLTPSFYTAAMTAQAQISYFEAVADAVPIPVIIYNVPKFTGINIAAETVHRLSRHENIIGIKDSQENIVHLSEVVAATPDSFNVLAGTGSILYPALNAGASGAIIALANIVPQECCKIAELVTERKQAEASLLQQRLVALNTAVTKTFGIAGLKYLLDLLGLYGGPVRFPLQPLSSKQKDELKQLLVESGIPTHQ